MAFRSVEKVLPLGVNPGSAGGGRIAGGTALNVVVGLMQVLGFAIPVATYSAGA